MGGCSKGYELSGNTVVLSIDNWQDALDTHKLNMPNIPILKDNIFNIDLSMLPEADLYHFSPPCQSFSTSGRQQGLLDDRGSLLLKSIDIINKKTPYMFVIENVIGLRKHLEDIKLPLNYFIHIVELNAKDVGVCQDRRRLFIVGCKDDFTVNIKKECLYRTFAEVAEYFKSHTNYGYVKHSEQLLEKIKTIPQGGNVNDIPANIRPKAFANSYSRLTLNRVPPTITRNYNCPSSANCIHPIEDRGLTMAEALFVQGFDPETWRMSGKNQNLQIGNCIPPNMIKSLIEGVKLL